jgi:hypothetical protein
VHIGDFDVYLMLCFVHVFGLKLNLLPHENHLFEPRLYKGCNGVLKMRAPGSNTKLCNCLQLAILWPQ